MYHLVKEIVTVTRFHLVQGLSQEAIQSVKDVANNAMYLDSCDEIHWEDPITYEVEDLGDDLGKDLRLKNAARHIDERLSNKAEENTLTPHRGKPIIKGRKKKVAEIDTLSLLENVE